MTVVTRNVKDFELAGVEVLNPFAEQAVTEETLRLRRCSGQLRMSRAFGRIPGAKVVCRGRPGSRRVG